MDTSPCGGAAAATSGMYRKVDFRRERFGVIATVKEIEYDPNRSARIALVEYADGEKRYILHPKGLSVGDHVVSGPGSDVRTGNALPLREMPLGTFVHNIELHAGEGRPDGPLGRHVGRGGGEGRRIRHAAPGLDGNAARARALPGDDRDGRQRRARADVVGQGRQDALAGYVARRCAAKS